MLCIVRCVSHVRQEPGFAGTKEAIGSSDVPSNCHLRRQRQGSMSLWGERRNRAEELRSHQGTPALKTEDFSNKSVVLVKRTTVPWTENPENYRRRPFFSRFAKTTDFFTKILGFKGRDS